MMRRRVVAVCAGVALGLGGLSACTGDDPEDNPSAVETDLGDPVQTMGEDGLPGDYPREDAPVLAGGEVTTATGNADRGFDITTVVDLGVDEALGEAVSLLEDAGWTLKSEDAGVRVLTKDAGMVILTVDASEDQAVLSYSVSLS